MRVRGKNGKELKPPRVGNGGEISSIEVAEKEMKKSRRYLVMLGAIGGGAALVYLKPKVEILCVCARVRSSYM